MLQPSVPAWFEIPSADLDRAVRFYEKVLDTRLRREDMGPMRMAVFPSEKPLPTGATGKTLRWPVEVVERYLSGN